MALEIVRPGAATTVQDRGRPSYYHLGIPTSGAMDAESAELANALVGNDSDAAVLECTLTGPKVRFTEPTRIAVAGAPTTIRGPGGELPTWTAIDLAAGDELTFGAAKGGVRYYLAVAGGIDVPVVLGSRSTYALGSLGGHLGRRLERGDVLAVGNSPEPVGPAGAGVDPADRPGFGGPVTLRVVVGLYDHRLTAEGKRRLLESEWTLTPVADRTGLRYSGPGVEWEPREQPFGAGSDPSNIVDAGYAVGSIQIPGGTEPIVLHRDAVSGGGYAMVATVISADMDLLARSAPGTVTRFEPVDMDAALAARADRRRRIDRITGALRTGGR